MADWPGVPTVEAEEDLDEFGSQVVKTSFAVEMVRWTGLAVQAIGALGIVAWGILTYLQWDRLGGDSGIGEGWRIRLALVLGSSGLLLLSAIAIGVGAGCRLLAEWSALRLLDEYMEDEEEEEPSPG